VCATIAAGVASSTSVFVTTPTAMRVFRLTRLVKVSTRGSSSVSGVRSAYTPSAFTLDLWPVV
jgi:hypothetical protein